MSFWKKTFGGETSEQTQPQTSHGTARSKVQTALDRYHKIDLSSDLEAFIRGYDDGTLVAMIEMLDIARLPVSIDTPGMHGMQCMKILELCRWLSQAERKEVMRAGHKKLSEIGHMEWRQDNVGVYADVMFKLGMDVITDGNDKMAYEILGSISAHGGSSTEPIVWQGACALNMGDKQKARDHFQQVLKRDSSNSMASDLLRRCQ